VDHQKRMTLAGKRTMDGQFHRIHYIWSLSLFFMTHVFHYHISESDSYVFFNFKMSYGSTVHT